MTAIRMLDPLVEPDARVVPLNPRLTTLDGLRVGLYNNKKANSVQLLDMVGEVLTRRYEIKEFVRLSYPIGGRINEDFRHCDVGIFANGD